MDLLKVIGDSINIAVICHVRPDGDTLGSGLALHRVLTDLGKSVDILCEDTISEHYAFIENTNLVGIKNNTTYDAVIAVDCADESRMGKYAGLIAGCNNSINIDHHKTNTRFAKTNHIFPNYSSTCEIVFELLESSNIPLKKSVATFLYTGLSTDTGNFCHSNTTANVFRIASILVGFGIDLTYLTTKLFRENTKNKTRLIARAIDAMRFFEDDKICIISLRANDIEACGCTFADTEGLIDYGMNIVGVQAAVCMSEQRQNMYKVSYRSRGMVDVAAAAGVFGGGGHAAAAGCVVFGFYEDVVAKILKSITDGMV